MADVLNPKLWKNDELLPEVKARLLSIANYFMDNISIDLPIIDILIVGSNASYNYTSDSDIDLHIVVNMEVSNSDRNLISLLANSEKTLFNNKYDIFIKGHPVEVYIEDVTANTISNGIYSLLHGWIKFPNPLPKNIPSVEREADRLSTRIKRALKGSKEDVESQINNLYMIRKNSIAIDGEYGKGNLIFKEVRNRGLLQDLKDRYAELVSSDLTLEGKIRQ